SHDVERQVTAPTKVFHDLDANRLHALPRAVVREMARPEVTDDAGQRFRPDPGGLRKVLSGTAVVSATVAREAAIVADGAAIGAIGMNAAGIGAVVDVVGLRGEAGQAEEPRVGEVEVLSDPAIRIALVLEEEQDSAAAAKDVVDE